MKNITIYSTPNCIHCKHAKEFFKENNLAYTEINVAGDPEKLTEMVEMTGQRGVPVIKIDDSLMVGYDRNMVAKALGI